MSGIYSFILIDDVPVNNLITKLIIQKAYPGSAIVQFTSAQLAIDYLVEHYPVSDPPSETILLLDIYMPDMDGWSFLEKYDQIQEAARSHIKVWMLTSSISRSDRERATGISAVAGYALKPFTVASLKALVEQVIAK